MLWSDLSVTGFVTRTPGRRELRHIAGWAACCSAVMALTGRAVAAQGAPALDSVPRGFPTADPVVQRIYNEGDAPFASCGTRPGVDGFDRPSPDRFTREPCRESVATRYLRRLGHCGPQRTVRHVA